VAKAISEHRPRVVIMIGIEESYYMAQFEVGYTLPATKDASGPHHINGELVVANLETQLRLLKAMEPIWQATKKIKTLVVSPMARYITKGCCDEPGHISNRADQGFVAKMKTDLLAAKYRMKTFFRDAGHNHCVVLDPAKDLEADDAAQVWGNDDPTLPLPEIFDKVAITVGQVESRADLANKKRPGDQIETPAAKRPKKDVGNGNDGQAGVARGRSYPRMRGGQRGRGRGGGGGSGGSGGSGGGSGGGGSGGGGSGGSRNYGDGGHRGGGGAPSRGRSSGGGWRGQQHYWRGGGFRGGNGGYNYGGGGSGRY
jgi:hypothetical protein